MLSGSTGNDLVIGSGGDDTYVFNLGDGQDVFRDSGYTRGGFDTVQFGAGIAPVDVTVTQADGGEDLVLTIAGTSDQVTLDDAVTDGFTRIEQVVFDDGTVWDAAELLTRATGATPGNDNFTGSNGADVLAGGEGDDTLDGFGGDDTLIGGPGNDLVIGSGGDDTFLFNPGDGQDVVRDSGDSRGGTDTLEFGAGIAVGDVTVTQADSGNDLVFTFAGSSDQVTLDQAINDGFTSIDHVLFADGTLWGFPEMLAASTANNSGNDTFFGTYLDDTLDGGAGDDVLDGRAQDDILIGGTGNDVMIGSDGDDTYVFRIGDGQDIVRDSGFSRGGFDTLEFGTGIAVSDLTVTQANNGDDLVVTITSTGDQVTIEDAINDGFTRVEQVRFADGTVMPIVDFFQLSTMGTSSDDTLYGSYANDTISGGAGNDTIDGGKGDDVISGGTGNDTLTGHKGNDTYLFNLGDGQDLILENGDASGDSDTLQFGAGITAAGVTVSQANAGTDLVLAIDGTSDQVTIAYSIHNTSIWLVETVLFDDGTTWSGADLIQQSFVQNTGNDTFYGSNNGETIDGGAGVDIIEARDGDDTLIGGTGNDLLTGSAGNDTYVFNLGDGQDTITESGYSSGGNDTLAFGAGIAPGDVTVAQVNAGNDFILTIDGSNDQVTLASAVTSANYKIEQVTFADGTVWTDADLLQFSTAANSGDDNLSGTSAAETLDGGAGNDTIDAGSGNDILIGGTGMDTLYGSAGDDTYVFNLGDGQDVIYEKGISSGGFDTIQFGTGITPTGVTVSQVDNGRNLVLAVGGTTDQIKIYYTIYDSTGWQVEQATFTDGTTWTLADMMQLSMATNTGNDTFYGSNYGETVDGGAGDDTIDARSGNDILIGGAGNDTLSGSNGNDTYVFNLGDGQDVIMENGYSSGGTDTLLFGAGITPAGVTVTQVENGRHYLLTIDGTSDQVQINHTIYDSTGWQVEEVEFDDGTVWTLADLLQFSIADNAGNDTFYGSNYNETINGGAGDDTLDGRNGNDILIGGSGNDILYGSSGNDTYIFNLGDGQDTIIEKGYSSGGTDTLEFGTGIAPSDVTVTRVDGGNDFLLTIANTTDQVTIDYGVTSSNYRVDQVTFVDGTVWTYQNLLDSSVT